MRIVTDRKKEALADTQASDASSHMIKGGSPFKKQDRRKEKKRPFTAQATSRGGTTQSGATVSVDAEGMSGNSVIGQQTNNFRDCVVNVFPPTKQPKIIRTDTTFQTAKKGKRSQQGHAPSGHPEKHKRPPSKRRKKKTTIAHSTPGTKGKRKRNPSWPPSENSNQNTISAHSTSCTKGKRKPQSYFYGPPPENDKRNTTSVHSTFETKNKRKPQMHASRLPAKDKKQQTVLISDFIPSTYNGKRKQPGYAPSRQSKKRTKRRKSHSAHGNRQPVYRLKLYSMQIFL
ncbi:uncharacterized protein [Diadema setosum]|uniref:uncharacterized protein n=1 Tax=Diadema setosum TaxID=31175 RepID=UPI003B3BA611